MRKGECGRRARRWRQQWPASSSRKPLTRSPRPMLGPTLSFSVSTSDQPVTGKDEKRRHWRGHQAEYVTGYQMLTVSICVYRSLGNSGKVPGDPPNRQPRQPAYKRPKDSDDTIGHVTRLLAVRHAPFRNKPRKQANEHKQQGVYESVSQTKTWRKGVVGTTIARSPSGVESELQAGFKVEVVHHCQNNF